MNEDYYIVDKQLPLSQDFKSLKDMGLAYIQSHIGNEWTNLNTSDPGVTILDQLCYALTELGYCNSFPVKDILTNEDGKLKIRDQFYLPEDILTTSPITVKDYIKYLIDGVDGVNNAVIVKAVPNGIPVFRTYQVYLSIDGPTKFCDEVCWAAFVYLNKCRNLGELFLKPITLSPVQTYLKGTIEIENKWNLNTILQKINGIISNYIFPKISPTGYSKLVDDGEVTNAIFDGPRLQNGWIPTDSLVKKRDSVNVLELIPLITSIAGVKSVSSLKYSDGSSTVSCLDSGKILFIDAVSSIQKGYIEITCDNEPVPNEPVTGMNSLSELSPEYETNILFGAAVEIQADLPTGSFRDINTYYSIQNTFPGIFAVGPDSLVSNATEYQIAQSRQLKGYLTLFDQMLANQFSQLANIDKLFSFENPTTGAPSDRETFFAQKDRYEKEHPGYPVPYLQFSSTYFYQSLYDIPYIKPLLKDHDIFDFSLEIEPEKVQEQKSWEKYKEDPYNAYMRGLMEIMEDESTGLARRNNILDHLLARHGESPLMINSFINGSFYTKNTLKDKVIFKSLYLQNLGLLSYFRYKACNYTAANIILPIDKEATPERNEDFEKYRQKAIEDDSMDFIFDSRKIDRIEKLREQDFVNFSGIELKLGLLFGLRKVYSDFFENIDWHEGENNEPDTAIIRRKEMKKQAQWFIKHRKGFIMVEMELLFQYFNFEVIITNTKLNQSWQTTENSNHKAVLDITGALNKMSQAELITATSANSSYSFKIVNSSAVISNNFIAIPDTDYSYVVKVIAPEPPAQRIELPNFDSDLEFLFPRFIYPFNTLEFSTRLNSFLGNELPAYLSHNFHLLEPESITPLASAFVDWHNILRCTDIKHYPNDNTIKYAWNLLVQIINVYAIPSK